MTCTKSHSQYVVGLVFQPRSARRRAPCPSPPHLRFFQCGHWITSVPVMCRLPDATPQSRWLRLWGCSLEICPVAFEQPKVSQPLYLVILPLNDHKAFCSWVYGTGKSSKAMCRSPKSRISKIKTGRWVFSSPLLRQCNKMYKVRVHWSRIISKVIHLSRKESS